MFSGIFRAYCYFVFAVFFLIILPFLWLFSWNKYTHAWAGGCYKFWAICFMRFTLLPVKIVRPKNKLLKPVIYCPNHSSYFDIPILYYVLPPEVCFLGKSELSQVPVFGPIFNRVHISVKRNSAKQGVESLKKASEMLERGRSVVIFPEGTIKADKQPHLLPFKDGAFRLAILTQRPIVPVYMPYNHDFMPDDGRFYPRWRPLQAHIGEPINPSDFKNEESLKNATEEVIKALRALHYPMLEIKPLAS